MPEPVKDVHLMLDLETLGQGTRSAIIEIGAVVFDPYGPLLGELNESSPTVFYRAVTLESALRLGLEVDESTIMWWFQQEESSRVRIAQAPKVQIGYAAEALRQFCVIQNVKYVWSHGASFDIAIMEEVYRLLRKPTPWDFHDVRDTRTLFSLTDLPKEKWEWLLRRPYKHHPVGDAWGQARAVQYCLTEEGLQNEITTGTGTVGSA